MEGDSGVGGPGRRVVQDAIPGVDLYLAVVAQHGHGRDDLLLGTAEDLVQAPVQVQQLGRVIEALHHRFERILLGQDNVLVATDDGLLHVVVFGGDVGHKRVSRARTTAASLRSQWTSSSATSGSGASAGQRARSFTASFSVTTT